jgi:hypothetical protein
MYKSHYRNTKSIMVPPKVQNLSVTESKGIEMAEI